MPKWGMAGLIGLACLLSVYLIVWNLPEKEPLALDGPAVDGPTVTVPDREADADAATPIYKSNCLSCHGDQLQGGYGPELAHIGSDLSKEEIYKTVLNGRRGMPAFDQRLTEDEIATIATWLASLK